MLWCNPGNIETFPVSLYSISITIYQFKMNMCKAQFKMYMCKALKLESKVNLTDKHTICIPS